MCESRSRGTKETLRTWGRVPIKFLRPVGKHTMAEVLHATAARLVWQWHEDIWVGYHQGMHSRETGGSGGGFGGIYFMTRVLLNTQTSAIEQRWPKHNFQSTPEGAGWTTRTAYLEGCLACTSCVYPPALLSAIAGNQPAVAVGLFWKIAPRMLTFMSAF